MPSFRATASASDISSPSFDLVALGTDALRDRNLVLPRRHVHIVAAYGSGKGRVMTRYGPRATIAPCEFFSAQSEVWPIGILRRCVQLLTGSALWNREW